MDEELRTSLKIMFPHDPANQKFFPPVPATQHGHGLTPFNFLTGLRSAVGEREKWSGGGETAGTESERNAAPDRRRKPAAPCGQ